MMPAVRPCMVPLGRARFAGAGRCAPDATQWVTVS